MARTQTFFRADNSTETRSASSSPDHNHVGGGLIASDDSLDAVQHQSPADEHHLVISHPSWQNNEPRFSSPLSVPTIVNGYEMAEGDQRQIVYTPNVEPYYDGYTDEIPINYNDGQFSVNSVPITNEQPFIYTEGHRDEQQEAWLSCL